MAPSTCPDLWETRRGSWFLAILCHISAYFCRIFGVCAVRIDLTSERSDGQYRLCACDACCSDALLSCQHTGRTFYTVLQHVLSTSRSAPRSWPSECGSRSRALSVKVAIVPVSLAASSSASRHDVRAVSAILWRHFRFAGRPRAASGCRVWRQRWRQRLAAADQSGTVY